MHLMEREPEPLPIPAHEAPHTGIPPLRIDAAIPRPRSRTPFQINNIPRALPGRPRGFRFHQKNGLGLRITADHAVFEKRKMRVDGRRANEPEPKAKSVGRRDEKLRSRV
jgi:hypothetical protein